jgi:hypothetical protein
MRGEKRAGKRVAHAGENREDDSTTAEGGAETQGASPVETAGGRPHAGSIADLVGPFVPPGRFATCLVDLDRDSVEFAHAARALAARLCWYVWLSAYAGYQIAMMVGQSSSTLDIRLAGSAVLLALAGIYARLYRIARAAFGPQVSYFVLRRDAKFSFALRLAGAVIVVLWLAAATSLTCIGEPDDVSEASLALSWSALIVQISVPTIIEIASLRTRWAKRIATTLTYSATTVERDSPGIFSNLYWRLRYVRLKVRIARLEAQKARLEARSARDGKR